MRLPPFQVLTKGLGETVVRELGHGGESLSEPQKIILTVARLDPAMVKGRNCIFPSATRLGYRLRPGRLSALRDAGVA